MSSRKYWWKFVPIVCFFLGGCQVGPQYEQPCPEIPCEWQTACAQEMDESSPDNFEWWAAFNDPVLDSLISRASLQNLDLHIALNRIIEARLIQKGGVASLYPRLDASASYGYLQYNQKTLNHLLGSHCGNSSHGRSLNFFEAGFDAEWEIDFFGKQCREISALKAEEEATQEAFLQIWVTLSAEIARTYFELRGFQTHLGIIEKGIETQGEIVELTQGLVQVGFIGEIELAIAEEKKHLLAAQKPLIELSIEQSIHRLSILLGYSPGGLFAELSEVCSLPSLPCYTPIGFPSELLRRRPDIRKAERELAASTERIGSAIASLFPRLSLYGFVGDIAALTKSNSFVGFAGPQLLLPIFNSRLLQQDVCLNKIRTQVALYHYQKTVLEALEEAENAIAAFHYQLAKHRELTSARNASQGAYFLTQQLYETGFKNYLEQQEAKRLFLVTEETYLQSQVDVLLQYIALYKALGGSWLLNCEANEEQP